MKKALAKLTALALLASMVLAQTVLAAGKTYDLKVTIRDDQTPQTAVTDTLRLLTREDKLIAVLAQAVLNNYDQDYRGGGLPSGKKGNMFRFGSPAMRTLMDEGLACAISGGGWEAYAHNSFTCLNDADGRVAALLKNLDATIGDYGVGTYTVTHKNDAAGDAKFGVTYTVVFEISEHQTGGGGGGSAGEEAPANPVVINADAAQSGDASAALRGGTVEISASSAEVGEIVTVTGRPDAQMMVNYVTVRDADGNKLPLRYDGSGSYSFDMPEGGVTVSVTFRREPASPAVTGVSALLDTDSHAAFMIGDDKGTFRPDASINRCEVAMIFYRLLRERMAAGTASFADVPAGAWYADAVETLTSLGIIKGVGTDRFEPGRPITRAEFAVICTRFASGTVGGYTFNDTQGHWAGSEISTAAAYGWIYGDENGSFAPDREITRQEAAAIVNRLLYRLGDQIAIDGGKAERFPDASDSLWGWYEIAEATRGHNHEQENEFAHEFWDE